MTHDLLRQTSKPRIPPPIPVRVESRIRRSSTLLSLPSYIDFLSSVGSRLSPSSFPPSLASNDNVSFVWIRLRVYRVINIELILCSMLLGYIKYYSNSFFIYLGNWDWILRLVDDETITKSLTYGNRVNKRSSISSDSRVSPRQIYFENNKRETFVYTRITKLLFPLKLIRTSRNEP